MPPWHIRRHICEPALNGKSYESVLYELADEAMHGYCMDGSEVGLDAP